MIDIERVHGVKCPRVEGYSTFYIRTHESIKP